MYVARTCACGVPMEQGRGGTSAAGPPCLEVGGACMRSPHNPPTIAPAHSCAAPTITLDANPAFPVLLAPHPAVNPNPAPWGLLSAVICGADGAGEASGEAGEEGSRRGAAALLEVMRRGLGSAGSRDATKASRSRPTQGTVLLPWPFRPPTCKVFSHSLTHSQPWCSA
jgi:hypothetical protein